MSTWVVRHAALRFHAYPRRKGEESHAKRTKRRLAAPNFYVADSVLLLDAREEHERGLYSR
jgi:hypothetical protein